MGLNGVVNSFSSIKWLIFIDIFSVIDVYGFGCV